MYAIRSYYAAMTAHALQHAQPPGAAAHAEAVHASRLVLSLRIIHARMGILMFGTFHVITSYSIHYTKLYDS